MKLSGVLCVGNYYNPLFRLFELQNYELYVNFKKILDIVDFGW